MFAFMFVCVIELSVFRGWIGRWECAFCANLLQSSIIIINVCFSSCSSKLKTNNNFIGDTHNGGLFVLLSKVNGFCFVRCVVNKPQDSQSVIQSLHIEVIAHIMWYGICSRQMHVCVSKQKEDKYLWLCLPEYGLRAQTQTQLQTNGLVCLCIGSHCCCCCLDTVYRPLYKSL